MKKFNIKDRKVLITSLCLIIVCVFTLTIAYAALNAVLTIQGNADIVASTWDIHLDNVRVKNGSATTNVPEIKSSRTLEFETTLNMPGDFYEFTVDVVNNGSIDAMIENIVITPELSEEQLKFLYYDVYYQNTMNLDESQILYKNTKTPIVVRIEYRDDLESSDLPTEQLVLDLSLSLEYVQSDNSGSSIYNNGIVKPQTANLKFGKTVSIGTEQFYIIGIDDENVKLLSKYNLYVGKEYNRSTRTLIEYGDKATGMQDSSMLGSFVDHSKVAKGTTEFSDGEVIYSGSVVEGYVNDYKNILESYYDINIVEARILTKDELTDPNTFNCDDSMGYIGTCANSPYPWIYSTSYWTMTPFNDVDVYMWYVMNNGEFSCMADRVYDTILGVRPVIVVPRDSIVIIPS